MPTPPPIPNLERPQKQIVSAHLETCALTCCAEKLESAFAEKKIRGVGLVCAANQPHPPLSTDLRQAHAQIVSAHVGQTYVDNPPGAIILALVEERLTMRMQTTLEQFGRHAFLFL